MCHSESLALVPRIAVRFIEGRFYNRREHSDAEAAIEAMPEMQLRALSYDQSTMWEENIFQPLLERCPRLEKLNLNWTHDEVTFQHLVKTLKENKLPALRHLRMAVRNRTELNNLLIEVLSHIPCGLESFGYENHDGNLDSQPLIRHHSHSLTNLDLHQSRIPFGTFLDLMVGLPCLQTVMATIIGRPNDKNDFPLNKHWECLGLRSLQLGLSAWLYYATSRDEGMKSIGKRASDYLFAEVAKLASLRKLRIRCDPMEPYSKSRGYLEQLAGLKQLEHLEIAHTKHNALGEDEAQWMVDNWPRLLQVYEQHAPAVFKETLLKGRPLVDFFKVPSSY
ncbi:MAG: hypothetical protein J3Q66DRAFT_138388 [Benniella sp.]|nr:MAG: hypothetical protein J3Q66DRAFT_138388 [Benniella sp.]